MFIGCVDVKKVEEEYGLGFKIVVVVFVCFVWGRIKFGWFKGYYCFV